jgi:hypothetical protein
VEKKLNLFIKNSNLNNILSIQKNFLNLILKDIIYIIIFFIFYFYLIKFIITIFIFNTLIDESHDKH